MATHRAIIPRRAGTVWVTTEGNRFFVEALFYRYQECIPWRDLPKRFADFQDSHSSHTLTSVASGNRSLKCQLLNTVLSQKSNCTQECIGFSRGGLTTKIHATCNALGNPTGFHLSPGQAHDLEGCGRVAGNHFGSDRGPCWQTLPTLQKQGCWIAWRSTRWKT